MPNLLEQAIDSDDGDRAARIIQEALGIESDDVANYVFRRPGRPTASAAPGSSASGWRPKRAFWVSRACTETFGRRDDSGRRHGGGGVACSCD